MTHAPFTLVGDGIENPANAETLMNAAQMFGYRCLFRDRKALGSSLAGSGTSFETITLDDLVSNSDPLIALDNNPLADSVYGFRVPRGPSPTVIVGNERHGIAAELQAKATHAVQIPMFSQNLNTLNVGAAAAVALYYLAQGARGRIRETARPASRRPELLLMAPRDHFEAGSSIRSAAAFGWERLFIDDRSGVWFGVDRARRSESRAAARRSRNPIRVIPVTTESEHAYEKIAVVSFRGGGRELGSTDLAGGPRQIVVVPDESFVDTDEIDWKRFGKDVQFVRPELPEPQKHYQYRLVASIVAAEVARQVGQRPRKVQERPSRRRPVYERRVKVLPDDSGETLLLEDLKDY